MAGSALTNRAGTAAVYCSKTFFISPTFFWTLPSTFSAVPRLRKSGFPTASPDFSFIVPTISLAIPLTLSSLLEFMPLFRIFPGRGLYFGARFRVDPSRKELLSLDEGSAKIPSPTTRLASRFATGGCRLRPRPRRLSLEMVARCGHPVQGWYRALDWPRLGPGSLIPAPHQRRFAKRGLKAAGVRLLSLRWGKALSSTLGMKSMP